MMTTDDEKEVWTMRIAMLWAVCIGVFCASVALCGCCALYPDDLPSGWVCVVGPLAAALGVYLVMRVLRPRS